MWHPISEPLTYGLLAGLAMGWASHRVSRQMTLTCTHSATPSVFAILDHKQRPECSLYHDTAHVFLRHQFSPPILFFILVKHLKSIPIKDVLAPNHKQQPLPAETTL